MGYNKTGIKKLRLIIISMLSVYSLNTWALQDEDGPGPEAMMLKFYYPELYGASKTSTPIVNINNCSNVQ